MSSLNRIYLSLVIFCALSILLIIFVVLPFFKGIREDSKELLFTKGKIIALAEQEEQLQKMEELYKTYQADLESFQKVFINPDVPLELIGFLEDTASSSPVQLKISSVGKRTLKQDPWPSLLIQLSATGEFPALLEFLEKIESGPYLIDALDITLRQLTSKDPRPEQIPLADIIAILSIKVYTK